MTGQAKKTYRSKWFRVAVEGATTDGRVIERNWIEEMAASYNRATYGARIWLEHFRSLLPDAPFRAYGDVIALRVEEVEIDGEKRQALYAQIEPTDDLVNMVNKLKQKIYTSIEVSQKFANTGKAYLMGLAVTDSPASLGTEVLEFAAQHPTNSPFIGRKQAPDNLFTAAAETIMEFEEIEAKPNMVEALFAHLDALFGHRKEQDEPSMSDVIQAFGVLREHIEQQSSELTAIEQKAAKTTADLASLDARFTKFRNQLDTTPNPTQSKRPAATGNGAAELTDC